MRLLLVEDEAPARRRLSRLLNVYGDVEIIGEAQDGIEALHKIEALRPEIVFLDVQMPELDGFGVVRGMSRLAPMPLIVFATGFDQHALAAFEANAIAYLLKPIEPARLDLILERARRLLAPGTERTEDQERVQLVAGSAGRLERIVGRKGNTIVLLDPDDVLWFHVEGGIVRAKTASESYWSNYQLAQLEDGLEGVTFFRARREVLVNLSKIKSIKPFDRSTFVLTMSDPAETELLVAERQAKALRQRFPGL